MKTNNSPKYKERVYGYDEDILDNEYIYVVLCLNRDHLVSLIAKFKSTFFFANS